MLARISACGELHGLTDASSWLDTKAPFLPQKMDNVGPFNPRIPGSGFIPSFTPRTASSPSAPTALFSPLETAEVGLVGIPAPLFIFGASNGPTACFGRAEMLVS